MGGVPSRENPDNIFSLRYGGHEIGLVPLLRRYFNDNNKELRRQFIRVWNDPSVRYHYPQTTDVPVSRLPPPMYTEEDLDALLDAVEKDIFDTNEEFMHASLEAAEYYAAREREECSGGSRSPLDSDPVARFMSAPLRKREPSSPSKKNIVSGVTQPDGSEPHSGKEGRCRYDGNFAVGAQNFPTFEAIESLESSTTDLLLPHSDSAGWMNGTNCPQNFIPSSLFTEYLNESTNAHDRVLMEKESKPNFFNLSKEEDESSLSNLETKEGRRTENAPGERFVESDVRAIASSGVDGRSHLSPHNVNIPSFSNFPKSEDDIIHPNLEASTTKARRCKRAIRPVPCAVLFVYVSGRKEADCFSFCGRKANVIGYFGCRTYNDERDNDVPYLQPCNIVLKAAGDRTVERVLILAARLYVEQFKQILARSAQNLNPILFFQKHFEAVRILVSALWNSYPTLKFVYDTAALMWAMNDISPNECLPSILWHDNGKNQQQRLLIRLDGKVVSRVWVWMSNLACMHMQRGNWVQFVLNDFTQYKDKFVANWLESSEAAAYFLQDHKFTKKIQEHLDQLHKEILRARETPQSDTTQWSDQQERSYDGKLYRIFLSPYCGPFLTTVKTKETEEHQKGGLTGSGNLDSWTGGAAQSGELFLDQSKGGQRSGRKGSASYIRPIEAGSAHLKESTNPAQRDTVQGMAYMMDPPRPQGTGRGALPLPGPIPSMNFYIPSASGNNMLMATQLPMNNGNMFSMPLLHSAAPTAWDASMSSPSEKTFSSMQGVMLPTTSIAATDASFPVIYYPNVSAFGAVGGGGGNMNPVVGQMNAQTLPPPTATDVKGLTSNSRHNSASVSTTANTNNAMYFVPVSPPPSNPGEAGSTRASAQQNINAYSDANAQTPEMHSFSMPPMYPFVGNTNNSNSVPSYPTSLPLMYTPGLPLYPPGQQQIPVFNPNYVMLSDGRVMTTFR